MSSKIYFYNENCFDTINKIIHSKNNLKMNVILTSPPYNTSRVDNYTKNKDAYNMRYDSYEDNKTDEEYIQWSIKLFNQFDKILAPNGTILYNLSYSSENSWLIWLTVSNIIQFTPFTVADTIIWKKKSAIPNNRSKNKLTRITEYIFVFCRKTEYKTFNAYKEVVSIIERTGQKNYKNIYNFIEAKNNDGSCALNKATFSSELCEKLLQIYSKKGDWIYDPFMGTGTTAVACYKLERNCVGSEISDKQVAYSKERLNTLCKLNVNQ